MNPVHPRAPRDAEPLEGEVIELPPPVPIEETPRSEGAPAAPSRGTDRVVAVAMAVTVSSIAVLGVLNFLAGDEEEDDARSRRRRR